MPYISLRLVGKLTRRQKAAIAKEFAQTLERVAGKAKDSTYLVFDEVRGSNWAKGEKLLG